MANLHLLIICDTYFNDINCLDDIVLTYQPKELSLCLRDNHKLKQHFKTSLVYEFITKYEVQFENLNNFNKFNKILYFVTKKEKEHGLKGVPETQIYTCIRSIVPKYCHFKLTQTRSVDEVYRYMGVNKTLKPEQKIHKLYTQQKRKRKRKQQVLKKKSRDNTGSVEEEGESAICKLEEYE